MVLAHDYNLLEEPASKLGRFVGLMLNAGWFGVQLFFVLSGFLITGILLDTRTAPNYWRSFLGRRAVRIFPLYYAVLLAAFVIAPLVHEAPSGSQHQVWFWTYLANWAEPFGRSVSIFPHFWSLSIEEQFYLFWPLFVRRLRPRSLVALCGGLVVAAIVSRVVFRASIGPDAAYMFTVCRADALALGAIGAVAVRTPRLYEFLAAQGTRLRWYGIALIFAVLAMKGAPRTGVLTQSFGYTILAIAFALLVVHAAIASAENASSLRLESAAPLRAIGRYSYAMYVFHTPLHILLGLPLVAWITGVDAHSPHGILFALAYFVGAVGVTFVAGFVSYHLLEKHFLVLKRTMAARVPR